MPYIKQVERNILDGAIKEVLKKMGEMDIKKGHLNYICYRLGQGYIQQKGLSYQNISDSVDALRGAGDELKRRLQDPYEDEKIKENGDINPFS